MSAETIRQALEDDERRAARDSFRAAGGSARRALKTFSTQAERAAARAEHRDRIASAVARLDSAEGFERWADSLQRHPHLSATNCALLAMQCPHQFADTVNGWNRVGYRIAKGQNAVARITGPPSCGFAPLPVFSSAQAHADDLDGFEATLPSPEQLEALRTALSERVAAGEKSRPVLDAIAQEIRRYG